MKKSIYLTGLALLAGFTTAHATLFTYNVSGTATIPDANIVGITSALTVSDIPAQINSQDATIQNVDVNLHITGGYNGDLYGYLVLQNMSGTTTSILLNRVGTTSSNPFGAAGSGFNVTLTGGATSNSGDIHTASETGGANFTGTYLADGRAVNPATVTDASSRTAGLDVFNGSNANGTWTLFLADLAGGDVSTFSNWTLNVSVVPEPITWALVSFGFLIVAAACIRRFKRA